MTDDNPMTLVIKTGLFLNERELELPLQSPAVGRGLKAIGYWFRELFGLRQGGRAAA